LALLVAQKLKQLNKYFLVAKFDKSQYLVNEPLISNTYVKMILANNKKYIPDLPNLFMVTTTRENLLRDCQVLPES
jgi:hypothetical protein